VSVINKMLRDLDARRADGAGSEHPRQASLSGMQGTVSVPSSAQGPVGRLGRWLLLALLVLAAGIAAAWYLGLGMFSPPPPAPAAVVIEPAPAAPVPAASAPEPVAPAAADPPAVVAELPVRVEPEPPAAVEPPVERKKKRRAESAGPEAAVTLAPERPEKKDRRRTADATASTPVPAPASPPAAQNAGAGAPAVQPQRGQTAARETLAQAQALWNAGSREPALDLVRDAVTVLERVQPVDVALLAQLVREQVRMELALGRPGAVLALLSRLEPLLSGQADLWAVRGNAAQRLGRHEESVQAYLAALQLRPGEARWMLGAAVSLAALGKTAAAAQQAEQARALGPVSPEVLTYLRQAGVPLP
jgi:Flp pilus assembly protein TadD